MPRILYGWLTALASSLPLWLGYLVADALTEAHFRLFPGRRHAALVNLTVILPRASRRERLAIVRDMMRSHNRMLFEFLRLPHVGREELLRSVEVVGREHLEGAVARRRGVILTSTHVGNWELAAVVLAHWGYHIHAVAAVQLSRWLTPAVRETKAELALETVGPEEGIRGLLHALQHGDLVALMVDGDVFTHGMRVELFGRELEWPAGPGVLAQRTGALVVCGFCERTARGRFRMVLEPPLDPATFPDAPALVREVARISERHIRDHLGQWCIFRPLWRPPTGPGDSPARATRRAEA